MLMLVISLSHFITLMAGIVIGVIMALGSSIIGYMIAMSPRIKRAGVKR